MKLTKYADPDKYSYSAYGIGFDCHLFFSFPSFSALSVHSDNKKKDTLVLDQGPTQVTDDTTMTAEPTYSITSTRLRKRFY